MAPFVAKPDPAQLRFARGLRLALASKPALRPAAQTSEDDGPAAAPAPTLREGEVGFLAAFPDRAQEAVFSVSKGQKHFESTVLETVAPVAAEMCFLCEWYPEPWPLENRDRTSSALYLAGLLDGAAELQAPKAEKELVLVFADRGGYCRRILEAAPERRVASVHWAEEPPP